MWQLRYSREATAGIYMIIRGAAADVSNAIKALAIDPLVGERLTDRPNTYQLKIGSHIVIYEVNQETQIIKILLIE